MQFVPDVDVMDENLYKDIVISSLTSALTPEKKKETFRLFLGKIDQE